MANGTLRWMTNGVKWEAWRLPALIVACLAVAGYAVRATLWVGEQEHIEQLQEVERAAMETRLSESIAENEDLLKQLAREFRAFRDHGARFTKADGDALRARILTIENMLIELQKLAQRNEVVDKGSVTELAAIKREIVLLRQDFREHRSMDAHTSAEARIRALQQKLEDLANGARQRHSD
jgi:uncharacterized protein YsxB (DUF464 family)